MKNKKIGLINIQRCDSHGAVLLAYALEKVMEKMAFNAIHIDYKYAGRIVESNIFRRFWIKMKIIVRKRLHFTYSGKKYFGKSLKKEYDIQSERFKEFRRNYLHLTSEVTNSRDTLLNEFDVLIVGSDVVWKPEIVSCEDREIYFLQNVPSNVKKIAYAASIGTNDSKVLKENLIYYRGAFDNFDYISVREASMISFVQQFTNKDVESMIDPVFLLEEYEYEKIEKNSIETVNKGNYIYLYLIGKNSCAIKEANKLAQKHNWEMLVDVNEGHEEADNINVRGESAISAGPLEFLYNIRNANYVITDSFHATAFSLIFNKQVCVFDRGNISVRMEDLLKRFDILNCKYSGKEICVEEIDWNRINAQIVKEREKGIQYLKKALSYEDQKCK